MASHPPALVTYSIGFQGPPAFVDHMMRREVPAPYLEADAAAVEHLVCLDDPGDGVGHLGHILVDPYAGSWRGAVLGDSLLMLSLRTPAERCYARAGEVLDSLLENAPLLGITLVMGAYVRDDGLRAQLASRGIHSAGWGRVATFAANLEFRAGPRRPRQ